MVSYIYDQSFTRGKGPRSSGGNILFLIIFVFTMLQRRLGRKEVSFD